MYLAEDTRLDRQVALKLLPADLHEDPECRARFISEAKAASALNHPNVCTIYEVGETEEGRPYIAMELVEGETLTSRVGRNPLPIGEIVDIGLQIADALDAAHAKKIVHRDIKPANISVNEQGRVKVLDFGLAKRLAEGETDPSATTVYQTGPGQTPGTPAYMSPEQALGQALDHRTDIFSFGAVLYELGTCQSPFTGSTIGETAQKVINQPPEAMARFNYEIPPELERIILKCLHKNPDCRYQTARELLVDLRNLKSEIEKGALAGAGMTAPGELRVSLTRGDAAVTRPDEVIEPHAVPPAEEVEDSDIFINCTLVDDQPVTSEKPGWVSQLRRNLRLRVEQLSGEPVKITAYPVPTGQFEVDRAVLESLENVKAMVSVVSPPFVKSEACRRKVEAYWQSAENAGRLWVDNRSRIFKAVKTPVSQSDVPPGLAALLSQLVDFEFFEEDPETGRLREFDETFGSSAQQRFLERVYDLAHDVCQVLRSETGEEPENGSGGKTVYLAETTTDLQAQRQKIRRELVERGHKILPSTPLPTVAEDLEEAVRGFLGSCELAVHLIGERYGLVPENSTESFVEAQMRLATEVARARPLQRLIWMPGDVAPKDGRQQAFIRRLRETADFLAEAELLEGGMNELKNVMVDKLTCEPKRQKPIAPETPPFVYLVCDVVDAEAVEALEDFLFHAGLEVRTPDFEAEESEAAQTHLEALKECDAVVFFYGRVRKSWLETQLREVTKVFGYGRSRPFAAQLVYLAPPIDRRKARFKTHLAETLVQPESFQVSTELESFVQRIRNGKATEFQE